MTLVTRLGVLFAVILSVSLFAAALSVWGSRQTQFHVARVSLAHAALEGYLSLSNNTYQLFKQYGDALIIGDRDQGRGERELVAAIRRDIASLRRIIGSEIDLVGEDEIGELEALSVIATKIEELIVAFDRLFAGRVAGQLLGRLAGAVAHARRRDRPRLP